MDNDKCLWQTSYDNRAGCTYWQSDCGANINLWELSPYSLGMKFCCFCGKDLKQGQ